MQNLLKSHMQKVFWDNPYQTELTTQIAHIDGNRVLLEKTIIFSFSGGQESDKATINEIPVLDSEIKGNCIYYTLKNNHGLHKGNSVIVKIDWPRRYRLMRLHFAAELILEIVMRRYNLEKIGAHISEDKARIDFYSDNNISKYFDEITNEFNEIIIKDLKISTGYSNMELQRRFWEIEGYSKVSCGGTHVRSTAEVGFVKLKRKNLGLSKERIEIMLTDTGSQSPLRSSNQTDESF